MVTTPKPSRRKDRFSTVNENRTAEQEIIEWYEVSREARPDVGILILLKMRDPCIGVVPGYWDSRCWTLYALPRAYDQPRVPASSVTHWAAMPLGVQPVKKTKRRKATV